MRMKTRQQSSKRWAAIAGMVAVLAIVSIAAVRRGNEDGVASGEARMFSGYVRDVRQGTVVIDEVEFLSGEVAIAKGAEDTECERENVTECIPSLNNDFYIRNTDRKTAEYPVSAYPEVRTFVSPGSPVLGNISFEQFRKDFLDPNLLMTEFVFNFRMSEGEIVKMEEQYTP